MKTLKSILESYCIKEVLIRDNTKLEVIVLKRNRSLSINEWVNFVIGLKYLFNKDIEFITFSKELNLDEFNHVRSDD